MHGADDSCPYVCRHCGCRLSGALGFGPPCGCPPEKQPFDAMIVTLASFIGEHGIKG